MQTYRHLLARNSHANAEQISKAANGYAMIHRGSYSGNTKPRDPEQRPKDSLISVESLRQ